MADDNELLKAAIADPVFNEYDQAAIKKELMLTRAYIAKELSSALCSYFLAFGAGVAIVFSPLSDISKGYLTLIASPSSVIALLKSGKLEEIVSATTRRK